MSKDLQLPQLQQLRDRVACSPGHVVLVVGAGVTIDALGTHECVDHATWRGLLGHGLAHAKGLNLIVGAQYQALSTALSSGDRNVDVGNKLVEALGGRDGGAYRAWLKGVFEEFDRCAKQTAVLEQIAELHRLGVRIATTNYDGVLEKFLGIESVSWRDGPAVEDVLAVSREAVVHLHGHWRSPESVILGNDDYKRLLADPQTERLMQAVRTLGTMVFVGMGAGLTDPSFDRLRAWARDALRESPRTHDWLVRRRDQGLVSATDLRDERMTPVVFDECYELPDVLRKLRPAATPSPSITNAQPRHILLLLNVRVKGNRAHLDAGLVRVHGEVELAEEDVIAVTMDGDDEKVADPRWWEEVGEKVRSAVEQLQERTMALGRNVVLVVAGHAPISVFAYAGHLSQQMACPVLFVNESGDKTSWDRFLSPVKDRRRVDYELELASDDSLQPLIPRHAVFASAGRLSGSKGDLCNVEQFESLKGKREPALAKGVAGLSQLVPRVRPGAQDSPGVVFVGWRDIEELLYKVATELVRLGGKHEHSRGVVAYLGPTWGAFELGRVLRPEVHGDVEVPHFSKSRNKYLPALTLSGVREPVWFRRPRFLLLGAEPVMETRARMGATLTASAQALKEGGFSGEDVVQWDGNVRLDTMHDRLVRFKPHVVLVLAHGNGDGTLGLIGPTEDARPAGADELVDAFRRSTVRPVLIVLLVCDSNFLGERLIHAADHVVVSENRLDIRNAETFSARFFALLAKGDSIHDAFETAKRVAVGNCPPPALRLLSNPAATHARRVFFHRG